MSVSTSAASLVARLASMARQSMSASFHIWKHVPIVISTTRRQTPENPISIFLLIEMDDR